MFRRGKKLKKLEIPGVSAASDEVATHQQTPTERDFE
jgi:hypothetical protein